MVTIDVGGGGLQHHSTTLTFESRYPSLEGGPTRVGPPHPSLLSLHSICSPPVGLFAPSFPNIGLGCGISGDLSAPPPSCHLGATSPRKSTCSVNTIWGEAWMYPVLRPWTTSRPRSVYAGYTEGGCGSAIGSGTDPIGRRHGGNLGPYNGWSFSGRPVWTHYEKDGGRFLE